MHKKSAGRKPAGTVPATRSPARKRPCTGKGGEEDTARDVWMDPDGTSLECSICCSPFEAEVFMCINGHAACAKCCLECIRVNRKCGSCGEPIGEVRCRPAENMLAEMYTSCKFKAYGCREDIKFLEKRAHEESCPRAPYGCPVAACGFRGMMLFGHIMEDHRDEAASVAYLQSTTVALRKAAPFHVLVQEDMRKVFLLLNGGGVLGGRALSLVCLGPRLEENKEINYKMEVRGAEPGALSMVGRAPCIRELQGFEPKKFLFVPDADWGPSGSVSVSVRIS